MLFVLVIPATAEVVQPNEDFWYLDQANVLSQETEGEIFFANQRLYDACGAEIVVVAIDSTDGMAIDDYAYTLFNDWQIGGSKYLGFLLLMSIEDEDYYAMPGTMLGTYIDSAAIAEMLDAHLLPDFSKGNYDAGALTFFEAMYAEVTDVLNLELSVQDAKADYAAFIREETAADVQPAAHNNPKENHGISVGVIVLILVLLILLTRTTRKFHAAPKRYAAPPPPPHRDVPPMPRTPRSSGSSVMTGYVLGRMAGAARNRRSVGMPPHVGHDMGGRKSHGTPSSFGESSFRGFSSGSSGVRTGGSGRSVGGFGGASRSSGASRGPSTRGGGAGRFSRRECITRKNTASSVLFYG